MNITDIDGILQNFSNCGCTITNIQKFSLTKINFMPQDKVAEISIKRKKIKVLADIWVLNSFLRLESLAGFRNRGTKNSDGNTGKFNWFYPDLYFLIAVLPENLWSFLTLDQGPGAKTRGSEFNIIENRVIGQDATVNREMSCLHLRRKPYWMSEISNGICVYL